jgi:hypothetical protein
MQSYFLHLSKVCFRKIFNYSRIKEEHAFNQKDGSELARKLPFHSKE